MADAINVNKNTQEIRKKRRLNAKRLDREEELQNRSEILAEGDDNREKGIKAVQEHKKEEQRAKDKQDADFLTDLESKKRQYVGYKKTLASALGKLLESLDWIKGWQAYCMATGGEPITIKGQAFNSKDGVLLVVTTPKGEVYHQGILTTGDPLLDYSALYTLAAQVENTMDRHRNLLLDEQQREMIVDSYGKPINTN